MTPRVDVERDGCGKWWVTLDGTRVSDHRDHVAARTAARRHPLATTVACPLPWPATSTGSSFDHDPVTAVVGGPLRAEDGA